MRKRRATSLLRGWILPRALVFAGLSSRQELLLVSLAGPSLDFLNGTQAVPLDQVEPFFSQFLSVINGGRSKTLCAHEEQVLPTFGSF